MVGPSDNFLKRGFPGGAQEIIMFLLHQGMQVIVCEMNQIRLAFSAHKSG